MGEKDVTELPGITDALGKKLREKELGNAKDVLHQFRVHLKRDKEIFLEWLSEKCSANASEGDACYEGLKAYCNAHPVSPSSGDKLVPKK